MVHPLITSAQVDQYQSDGVVLIRGLFSAQVDLLRAGVAKNMDEPGPYASNNDKPGESGRFFDDYCNWTRIPEFKEAIETSAVAEVAADLMQSNSVQMFHDHVLVKEPGTSMSTPWHQDGPYYFVEGMQTVSFWSPLDVVSEATLRCVIGSHKWPREVLPTRWVSEQGFFADEGQYIQVPNPDEESMPVFEGPMQPGDAVAFNFKTLHGARGNNSAVRRRAFSLRLVGDDVRYVERPGSTSPPFPGHDMVPGQRLREDWFPMLLQR